ncbi:hypothetical protein, partial [uncultured Desulfovibrio sp.]|uniref:hypothetical protein n=1 Tax=uncultured Desulfovibrio sp. TaxID=167968 RepID=UPI0026226A91
TLLPFAIARRVPMPDNVGNILKIKIILNSARQQGCIVFMRICIQARIKFVQVSFFYSIS